MNITAADLKVIDILASEGGIDAAVVRIQAEFPSTDGAISFDTAHDLAVRASELLQRLTPPEVAAQGFASCCLYHRYLHLSRASRERGDLEMQLKAEKEIDKLLKAVQ